MKLLISTNIHVYNPTCIQTHTHTNMEVLVPEATCNRHSYSPNPDSLAFPGEHLKSKGGARRWRMTHLDNGERLSQQSLGRVRVWG